jgi:hypothetical protein
MLSKVLEFLASKLPAPRIIYDRAGVSPYLSRWYLIGRPTMPNGSHPFTEDGSPKEGILDPDRPFAIFLHKFHRGDDDLELHNHPWAWSMAIVLSGGYREERRRGAPETGGCVFVRDVRPPAINIIHHDTFHRVELLEKDAWSIFVAGTREKGWGFWNRSSGVFTPWREFITKKREILAWVQKTYDDERRRIHERPASGPNNTFYARSLEQAARAEEREHCVGGEPLVEVDIYPVDCAFTRHGGECETCESREKRAEHGDPYAHTGLTTTFDPS